MPRSSRQRAVRWFALGLLFTLLLTACRVDQAPNLPSTETSVAQPTKSAPEVTQTPVSQQVGPEPSPTEASNTIPATPTRSAVDLTLTILHTGQVRGEVDPCGWRPPKGGLARRATAIAQIRRETEGTVLVFDTGDALFGKPASNKSQGALPVAAMGAMAYDAMALGEVDLGAKAEILQERFVEAGFPILSANLKHDGVLPIEPYMLLEVEGHTVAIIGATAVRAGQRESTVGVDLEVEKAPEAIPPLVEELRDQADIVIILSNLTQQTNLKLAQEVAGIDLIIGTRDANSPTQVQHVDGPDGRVILQGSGRQGQQLALLKVHFDANGQVTLAEGQGLILSNEYVEDPGMLQLMEQYSSGN